MSKTEAREIAEELEQLRKDIAKKDNRALCLPIGIISILTGILSIVFAFILLGSVPGYLGETLVEAFNLGIDNGMDGFAALLIGVILFIAGVCLLRKDFKIQIEDAVRNALENPEEGTK